MASRKRKASSSSASSSSASSSSASSSSSSTTPKGNKAGTISWAKNFRRRTESEVVDAIGSFPLDMTSQAIKAREELSSQRRSNRNDDDNIMMMPLPSSTKLSDVDNRNAFDAIAKMSRPLPSPNDESDWLAMENEEGQTVEEYTKYISMRSGRFKPFVGARQWTICLVPILHVSDEGWQHHGPPLEDLVSYTEAFFQCPVSLLDPAFVGASPLRASNRPGDFAKEAKVPLTWTWNVDGMEQTSRLRGRIHKATGRIQIDVDCVLSQLSSVRECGLERKKNSSSPLADCNMLVGVTMLDLMSQPSDLFIAGMAAGGSRVGAFSFHRYHPAMKMSPSAWHDYGYGKRASPDSYYRPGVKVSSLSSLPPSVAGKISTSSRGSNNGTTRTTTTTTTAMMKEFLRRAGKLLVHELAHIFQIDHCIFYDCVMRGTGHLVEDFAAPSHLCPVDLRKLQYRLGFDLRERHESLARIYERWGLLAEAEYERNVLLLTA